MYRPPPTSAGGVLLCLQLYAVLSVFLLAFICGLLLLPHKSNDLLHLLGTEIVPYSSKITFHRVELRIFSFHLFQPLAQMMGSFLLILIEILVPRLYRKRHGAAGSPGRIHWRRCQKRRKSVKLLPKCYHKRKKPRFSRVHFLKSGAFICVSSLYSRKA